MHPHDPYCQLFLAGIILGLHKAVMSRSTIICCSFQILAGELAAGMR